MGQSHVMKIFSILISNFLLNNVYSYAEDAAYFSYQLPEYPKDCKEVLDQCSTPTSNGVYLIKPDGYDKPFEIFCDNELDGGGWTVIQRRNSEDSLEFRRNWEEYRNGFGFLSGEFWLGNRKLSYLTNQKKYQLRIDMVNSSGSLFYITYDLFRISDEWSSYILTSTGKYNGATDMFINHCPQNMVWGNCSCQPSCDDPSACLITCTEEETCICPEGFMIKDGVCVSPEECSCFVQGFGVIPKNKVFVNPDCSELCTCDEGTLACDSDYSCDSNAVCEERDNVRQCYCKAGFTGQNCATSAQPNDCQDVFTAGSTNDGVYTISPVGWTESPFEVYCNMSHGGGWMVFQRRVDGSVDFYRNWTSYKEGFGTPGHELWLGNDKLYYLTNQKDYILRIDLVNKDGVNFYLNYDLFRVSDENNNYQLQLGSYTGNAGYDYMVHHRNRSFTTFDNDNDECSFCGLIQNCAFSYQGAWWYLNCYSANLNGDYSSTTKTGVALYNRDTYTYDHYSLRYTQMKIRPI